MPSGPGTYGSKRGRPPMKMKAGGSVTKKMSGGKMTKKMGKGGTLVRGTGAQRSGRMARGPMG